MEALTASAVTALVIIWLLAPRRNYAGEQFTFFGRCWPCVLTGLVLIMLMWSSVILVKAARADTLTMKDLICYAPSVLSQIICPPPPVTRHIHAMPPAHHHVMGDHEPAKPNAVDQFYLSWKIPVPGRKEHRQQSCCNKADCYQTSIRKNMERGGRWEYLRREDLEWLPIPEGKLEHMQTDPRHSPNGESHVCADKPSQYSGVNNGLKCAVLGESQS